MAGHGFAADLSSGGGVLARRSHLRSLPTAPELESVRRAQPSLFFAFFLARFGFDFSSSSSHSTRSNPRSNKEA